MGNESLWTELRISFRVKSMGILVAVSGGSLGGMFAWKGVTTDSANGQPLKPFGITYVPGSKLPLFPYIIGDGHQPNSRGLYTHY